VNTTYHINLFWYDEERAWVADVPDLEPCTTFGASRAEALAKAEELIDLWLESARENGDAIPEPRYRPAIYAFRAA
jgi:predicted RNase H-like HicB family nuclease